VSEPVGLSVIESDYGYTRIREGIPCGKFEAGTVLHQSMLAKTIGISTTPSPKAHNTSLGAKAASRLGVEPVTAPRLA